MNKLTVQLKANPYPIYFSSGASQDLAKALKSHFSAKRWVLVTNPRVFKLHGKRFLQNLRSLGEVEIVLIPDGEKYKNLRTVEKLYKEFLKKKVDRRTPVLALGGGVVGDVVGFAAATFLRGVPFVQIPTTLLAQVDSSVGGKTGVDLAEGKNLVGAFYQPHLVFIDVSVLKTLPSREWLCGSAEVIKYGAILDSHFFTFLEKNLNSFLKRDLKTVQKIVQRCVEIKADVVKKDEKETSGLRALLNFGHTLGHAIETLSGYSKFSHGEAIAIGMAFAADLSFQKGFLSALELEKIRALLKKAGFSDRVPPYSRKAYLRVLSRDKKMAKGKIHYVLLKKIGKAFLIELELQKLGDFVQAFNGGVHGV